MQLASYIHDGIDKIGAVLGDDLLDLPGFHATSSADPFPTSMRELIDLDQPYFSQALELVAAASTASRDDLLAKGVLSPIADCTFRLPVTDPGQMICVGRNYRDHAAEAGHEVEELPRLFLRTPASLSPSGESIMRPVVSEMYDFEGELAVVIGRVTRHVSIEEALSFVAGYTAFNDGSIRDWQHVTNQVTNGKNFYKSGGFGPWITTTDEAPAPDNIVLRTRLNDEVVQEVNTGEMVFSVAYLISYISAFTQLMPGDVISTGTPAGVGAQRTPALWLEGGDEVTVELEGVGTLVNFVEDEIEPRGKNFQAWRILTAIGE